MSSRSLFGFSISCFDMDIILEKLDELMKKESFSRVVTLNPLMVTGAFQNRKMHKWIQKADLIVPDGNGIAMAFKWLKNVSCPVIPGVDMVLKLLETRSLRVYFVGATEEVVKQAALNVGSRYPEVSVVGYHHGYFSETETEALIESIAEAKPDLILVGMGFPLQEQVIQQLEPKLKRGVAMGVGGVIDILSGTKCLAPTWVRALRCEWVYRAFKEPRRLLTWGGLVKFGWLVLKKDSV